MSKRLDLIRSILKDEENALNPGLTNPLPHILFNSPSASENSATPASSSGRFSARSGERQSILAERKASLIRLHRKYIFTEILFGRWFVYFSEFLKGVFIQGSFGGR